MKKLACIFLLAVMLVNCLFVSMPAYAAFEASQTFTPVADGHYDTNPTFKGTETSLMTTQVQQNKPNASDVGRTAFLKFGLTDIKSNIAAGAEISKATVKLYVSKQLYTGSTVAYMSLFAHDDNWDEAGNNPVIYNLADLVTVSKDPQNPSNGYVSLPAGLAAGTEITLDITDALKAEAAKADDDYLSLEVGYRGVWISSGTTYFYSRENTTEAYRPQLYVEYTEAVVPEPIVKEFKLDDLSLAKAGPLTEVAEITVAQGTSQYAECASSEDARLKNTILSDLNNGDTTLSLKFNLKAVADVANILMIRGHEYAGHAPILRVKFSDSTSTDLKPTMSAKALSSDPDTAQGSTNPFYLGRGNSDEGGTVETRVAFAKFDISSLLSKKDSISGVQIIVKPQTYPINVNFTVGVFKIYDDEWTNATVTWNNMPRISEMIEIDSLEAGNIKVTAEFSNTLDTGKTFNAILAVYKIDASGKYELAGVRLNPITVASGNSEVVSAFFNLAELSDGESYVGKVMVLDGIATLVPMLSVTDY